MDPGGVLVLGCLDVPANTGLKADEKADERTIAALQVPVAAVCTGSASGNAEAHADQVLRSRINNAMQSIDCKVLKIGAMFSVETIKITSEILQQSNTQLMSVIDVEPFFKTDRAPPKPEVVTALRKHLLPSITLLSATVPGAMQLLADAGIPVDHPRGIPDVQAMAETLAQRLGPQYVVIQREFVDEDDGATTLHYVLVGGGDGAEVPVKVTSRSANPKRVLGVSYYVSPAIAAYLAQGRSVPDAVSAGFEFIGEMLKGGDLFQ